MRLERWSTIGYAAAALASAVPAFASVKDGRLSGWTAIVWLAGFAVFTAGFAAYRLWPSRGLFWVAAETLAGLTMVCAGVGLERYTSGVTLVIVAGQLPYVLVQRAAWVWLAAQSAALLAAFGWFDGWMGALSGGGAFVGTQVFALARAMLERRGREMRDDLTRTNAELLATRARLAESSRIAERLRISRDLHDSMGHHLTALSIQLDVATRRSDGPAAEHIREAHGIARLLLSDVRDVVSRLRDTAQTDVVAAIRQVAVNIGDLRVHIETPEAVYLDDESKTQTIVHCVQELITNTARHAAARNLWINLDVQPDGLRLHTRDDGRGSAAMTLGFGLTGMRERFAQHGGRVEFTTAPGAGFEARAFLPQPASPS